MERKYFLFRKEWCDAVRELPSKIRLEVMDAVMSYGIYGEEPELGKIARATFGIAKTVIDRDCEELTKRDNWLAKCREAGKKGGRPKKGDGKPTVKGGLKEGFSAQNTEILPAAADPSSRAHDIGSQENNIDDKNKNSKIKKETQKKENENLYNTPKPPQTDLFGNRIENPEDKDLVWWDLCRRFVAYFNREMANAKAVIPHNAVPTKKRVEALHARVREHGKNSLVTLVQKAAKSDYLNGLNKYNWIASLDWLLRPNNFVKVIEGNFDNEQIERTKNKFNDYGNNKGLQNYDPRRGVEAGYHSPEEYE